MAMIMKRSHVLYRDYEGRDYIYILFNIILEATLRDVNLINVYLSYDTMVFADDRI